MEDCKRNIRLKSFFSATPGTHIPFKYQESNSIITDIFQDFRAEASTQQPPAGGAKRSLHDADKMLQLNPDGERTD